MDMIVDTLVSMRTFRSVAEQGSFVAASRRMGLSPAATSKHVMRLEERLGVRLLNRNSRNVSLTEEGERYLERLVESLDSLDEAEAAISDAVIRPHGHLRISAPVWAANPTFAAIFTEFREQYPEVTLEIDLTGRQIDLVGSGVDIALRVSDKPGDHYIARQISEVVIEWVASPDYLKKVKRPNSIKELRDHKILWYSEVPSSIPLSDEPSAETLDIEPVIVSGNECLLHHAVLKGAGIAALPRWMTQDDKNAGRLVSVFKNSDKYRRPLLAVYQTRRHVPSKIRCFLDFLIDNPLLKI